MSICVWTDQDGDAVAVDTALIVGVSVGRIAGPRDVADECVVTLIWTTAAQPFMVTAPFAEVVAAWRAGRQQDGPPLRAYSGVFPLVAHQYPDGGAS